MICSKWKEERSKLSGQHDLGHLQWNWANHSRKLCNDNAIKTMNHILILSRSEEGTLILNARNTIQGDSCWHWANQIQYKRNQHRKFKKHWFAQSQEKAQLNPAEQQDRAVNHYYRCMKGKITASKHEKKITHLGILGNICITIVC